MTSINLVHVCFSAYLSFQILAPWKVIFPWEGLLAGAALLVQKPLRIAAGLQPVVAQLCSVFLKQ